VRQQPPHHVSVAEVRVRAFARALPPMTGPQHSPRRWASLICSPRSVPRLRSTRPNGAVSCPRSSLRRRRRDRRDLNQPAVDGA
jgi:hypothetical protein